MSCRPVAHQRPAQQFDVVISALSAAVEPLIDNDGLLVSLRKKVALEVVVARFGRVGHVDIGYFPVRSFVNLTEVAFNPRAVAQSTLIGNWLDVYHAGTGTICLGTNLELDSLAN